MIVRNIGRTATEYLLTMVERRSHVAGLLLTMVETPP